MPTLLTYGLVDALVLEAIDRAEDMLGSRGLASPSWAFRLPKSPVLVMDEFSDGGDAGK